MSKRSRNTNAQIQQRYAPMGNLALQPQAFGMMFYGMLETAQEPVDGVAVINIRGPLMQHSEWFFDSYEDIKCRVSEALENNSTKSIVLAIDSPGGVVYGCFDAAREIRAMCAAANIPLYAHISGAGCSAAYAIATAASYIAVSQSATVGSIGVLHTLIDLTQQNQMFGANIVLVASGARKTDGNPNQPITDGAMKASKENVDQLAEMFFALCAEHGWSDVESIRNLEAASFTGERAVQLGLASAVASLESTIALAKASPQSSGENNEKGNQTMASPLDDAKANLRKTMEEGTDEEKEAAKKALAALGENDGDGDDDDSSDDSNKEKAEGEDKDKEARGANSKPVASAADPHAIALQALTAVHNLKAEREQEKLDQKRDALIASRDDLDDDFVAYLKTQPLASVEGTLKSLKKGPPVKKRAAKAVQGAVDALNATGAQTSHGGTQSRLPAEQKAQLDAAMGISTPNATGVRQEANKVVFGVAKESN